MAQDLVSLHTNLWIRTHPLHLLSQGSKTVEVVRLVGEIDRNNVRTVLVGTCEPAEPQPRKQIPALFAAHFAYQHFVCSLSACRVLIWGRCFSACRTSKRNQILKINRSLI